MSVGAGIVSALEPQTIKFTSKTREVDLEGYDIGADKSLSFTAGVLPSGSKFKKGDQEGTIGVDDNELFACGQVDVQLNDELEFCNGKGKVIEVEYWSLGGYTRIVVRLLSRKGVSQYA